VTTNALAWVTIVGATGAINASYNVSSVVRNSTGNYTVNFTTTLTNANYSIVTGCGVTATTTAYSLNYITGSKLTTSCVVTAFAFDPTEYSVSIFGN
jgi:hypothetical protein